MTTSLDTEHVRTPRGVPIPREVITGIAGVCHEQNRMYAMTLGDFSHEPWATAPDWARESTINGVIAIAEGRVTQPGDSHRSWLREKERTGWMWGPVKDAEKKEHPCMVPFEQLPEHEQVKDVLFVQSATALLRRFDPQVGAPATSDPTPARSYEVPAYLLDDLKRRFTYHAPQPDQLPRYTILRERARLLAEMIVTLTPQSREQALALTHLEEAAFWSNAAIARHE